MERGEDIVQKEIRLLVEVSCQSCRGSEEKFRDLHRKYLKFSFNAVDVKIDYEAKIIYSSNSKPLTTNPVRLFDMNKALADQFAYSDLEETLLGCLGSSHLHYMFYKKLLVEYGGFSTEELDNLSA